MLKLYTLLINWKSEAAMDIYIEVPIKAGLSE